MTRAVLPRDAAPGTPAPPPGAAPPPVPDGGWNPPRRRLARLAEAPARWRERPAWQRETACATVSGTAVLGLWLWWAHRPLFWLAAVLAVLLAVLAVRRRRRRALHRAQVAAVWAGVAAATGHAGTDGVPHPGHHLWLHVPKPGRRMPEQTRPGRLAVLVLSRSVLPSWDAVRVRGRVLVPGRDADLPPRDGRAALWVHRALMRRAVASCVIRGHVVRHHAFRPKTAEAISGVLNRVYPGADLQVAVDAVAQTWTASPKPRPPETAAIADPEIEELIEEHGSATRLLAGLTASGAAWLDLAGETPHIGMSVGTGGGKSSLFRLLGAQVWYHGAGRIDIVDPKRISLDAFKGIPGIHIWRDVELQIKAVEDFYEEMTSRYEILEDDPDAVFPPRFLFMEEMNSWTDLVTIWWRQNKESGDPARPPILDIFALCLYQGRQAAMHIFVALQQANARATGGSALRDQLGGIFLARFSPNVWNFLTGNLRPVRRASKHPGRAVLVVHGDVTDIQMVYASPGDARAFALRRGQPAATTPCDRDGDVTATVAVVGDAPPWETSTDAVTELSVTEITAGDGDGVAVELPEPRLTLPDAIRAGVVPMKPSAARMARMRDPEFPSGEGEGRHRTYTEEELRGWFANRA